MIASTPVARWTWGRDEQAEDEVAACLHELMTACTVLFRHRLVIDTPSVSVSVHEAGKPNTFLFRENVELDATWSDPAQQLTGLVKAALRPGKIGSVYADANHAGYIIDGNQALRAERLCHVGASVLLDYVSVDLVTFSDAWMPYDLKGRGQPTVYAANAPRLSAALRDLSEALDSETDPDDPTYFGKPTEAGVENYLDEGGAASDVWAGFEIPRRYSEFRHAPGFGRIGYKRSVNGDVQYVPVKDKHGVLGYLWASDSENGASFEPRDVDDDEKYKASLSWLKRLESAHDQGLSPSQALAELASLAEDDRPSVIELDRLRELANDV
ncbi:hypothetical protein Sgleb_43870 [Streptomyces glebosus]|uniref:Uncharacterized protein n=1 Tax=Streptomyces glebosus TaxID=249580 RepID=A0A640SZG1_9ACTN|nr:hypothetical protein [Streptomyces glebosus]GFE16340.1 hypothetical protein Sgleb_43870 [Streptomyces glebosus]GHG64299.1 hypothetical protein GCM10010513_32230 [Streptomyces glebosus]